ncbi:hypothetical protein PMAYCL1PPCAC_23695, partial [Pristionchus mayeri]
SLLLLLSILLLFLNFRRGVLLAFGTGLTASNAAANEDMVVARSLHLCSSRSGHIGSLWPFVAIDDVEYDHFLISKSTEEIANDSRLGDSRLVNEDIVLTIFTSYESILASNAVPLHLNLDALLEHRLLSLLLLPHLASLFISESHATRRLFRLILGLFIDDLKLVQLLKGFLSHLDWTGRHFEERFYVGLLG